MYTDAGFMRCGVLSYICFMTDECSALAGAAPSSGFSADRFDTMAAQFHARVHSSYESFSVNQPVCGEMRAFSDRTPLVPLGKFLQ